jgi:hypothetical protein
MFVLGGLGRPMDGDSIEIAGFSNALATSSEGIRVQ